jgi:putative transcriptional regulator
MTTTDGKIIIAASTIDDPIFNHTVIYIHKDNDTGSVGIILNAPMNEEMANKWSNEVGWEFPQRIRHGGPKEHQLGYIIHSNDYEQSSSVELNPYISYTSGTAIIRDIARGIGPYDFLLLSGYCGWKPNQLNQEIENGNWIVTDFDIDYFFLDLDRIPTWETAIHLAAHNNTETLLDNT